jgi:hypothetical protein
MLKPVFFKVFVGRYASLTGLLIFILLTQISCSYFQELKEERKKAESELTVICKNILIPSDFVEIDSEKHLDVSKVAIFKSYKSTSTCKVAEEHFRKYFIGEGWDPNQMQVRQRRGGMKMINFDFRNREYLVSVECQNDVDDEAEKQIVVSCSWGLR